MEIRDKTHLLDGERVENSRPEDMKEQKPQVFSEETTKTIDKVVEKWENVKRKEKGQASYESRLANVPRALPALVRSFMIQQKAAMVGFDWEDVVPAFQKITEETIEIQEACKSGDKERITDELGDLLFSVVNVARFLEVDPEQALNSTSDKFIRRFGYMEKSARVRGMDLEEMTLSEMDHLWDLAKESEKNL